MRKKMGLTLSNVKKYLYHIEFSTQQIFCQFFERNICSGVNLSGHFLTELASRKVSIPLECSLNFQ